ncbi:MAG: PaaI family thioesterase [Clostridia bacterium]|nr:PaaI family thioesterase [Clostridia bacterium]
MDSCNNDQTYFGGLVGSTNNPAQFSAYNGITVTEVKDGVGVGELAITPHSLNPMGIVHGGCLAALADTVAGVAVAVGQHSRCVTVNYSMSFLRPAKGDGKKIVCTAAPHKLGRTLCVYGVSLTDDGGKEVASGTFTFCLMKD